jgi:CD109 antigen
VGPGRPILPPRPTPGSTAQIETTAYAALALLQAGDVVNASRAIRWLASKRNALGGYGSTQDTVVALQAMTTAASSSRSDVNATVQLTAGDWSSQVRIGPDNADVLQVVAVPARAALTLASSGSGQVMAQVVRRYNVPEADAPDTSVFQVDVRYGADHVEVNDLLDVNATLRFNPPAPVPLLTADTTTPPEPVKAGMVVLDVAVPTGFEPEAPSLQALLKSAAPKLKRYEVAGRKVVLYVDDMEPGESQTFSFQARALYPVRAQAVTSQAYSYYRPEWRGESLGGAVAVGAEG